MDEDPIEALIRRSKRQRNRGDPRTAVVLLQRACSMDEWRARTFTLLGVLLLDLGKRDDAERALRHARWLRQRAGEISRAEVTMRLIDQVRRSRPTM
jgi:Flp pilus assembly protein TadD